jgi:hypothetical protein
MSHRRSLRRHAGAFVRLSFRVSLAPLWLAAAAASAAGCSGVATPDIFFDAGPAGNADANPSTPPPAPDDAALPDASAADATSAGPAEPDAAGGSAPDATTSPDATTAPPLDAAANDAVAHDAPTGDARPDVSIAEADAGPTFPCGTTRCAASTEVCCVSTDLTVNAPPTRCVTGTMCPAGSAATLECASDEDCPATDLCCLASNPAANSQCRPQCNGGTRELCQMGGTGREACSGGQRCVMGPGGNLGRALPNTGTCQ